MQLGRPVLSVTTRGQLREMLVRALLLLLTVTVLFPAFQVQVSAQGASSIRVLTEEFPPYDFKGENGRTEGFATDVVREALNHVGQEVKIEILPWARAYRIASSNPNVMLFSVVRSSEREGIFHWLGVVCEVRSYLFKLKSRSDIPSSDLDALRQHKVGVVRGWAGHKYLEKNGFVNLQTTAVSQFNIRKLLNGRVDLIEDYEANVIYRMRRMGLNYQLLEKVYFNADISGPLFAVLSKETPDQIVSKFKKAFSRVHLDGRYIEIKTRWLSASDVPQ